MARYIHTYNHQNELGVMLEIYADDDFTFKTDTFKNLALELSLQVAASDPAADSNGQEVLSLLNQRYIKDESINIRDLIHEADQILKAGIKIKRYIRYKA